MSAAGRAAQDEGNHELAVLAYRAAFEVDPVAYTLGYSSALRRVEQSPKAEAILIDSLETHLSADQRTTWWRALGDLYRNQGDWQNAEIAYRAALREDSTDQAAWVRLGWLIYDESGEAEAAMEYFNEAIRVEPESGMGYYAVGRLLVREEQPEQALGWYQKASENEPQSLNNLLVYANLLRDTGQFELAFIEYEKAIKGWPDSWYPYYHVSWAYLLNGQPDQAFHAIEKTIELNPDNVGTHLRAGEIYEAFGEVDLALAAYQAVLDINANNTAALRAIERLSGGD
ncbi:MAG: tetratricopeptide repeat protein [Anaerolineaceae bacterium]|nr:tetratricopeptide repeat protein [Anaerolineaceae bacterium]